MNKSEQPKPLYDWPNNQSIREQALRIIENEVRKNFGMRHLTAPDERITATNRTTTPALEEAILAQMKKHELPQVVKDRLHYDEVLCADEATALLTPGEKYRLEDAVLKVLRQAHGITDSQ